MSITSVMKELFAEYTLILPILQKIFSLSGEGVALPVILVHEAVREGRKICPSLVVRFRVF